MDTNRRATLRNSIIKAILERERIELLEEKDDIGTKIVDIWEDSYENDFWEGQEVLELK